MKFTEALREMKEGERVEASRHRAVIGIGTKKNRQ